MPLEQLERLLNKATRLWTSLRSLYGPETQNSYFLTIPADKIINGAFSCATWYREFDIDRQLEQTPLSTWLFNDFSSSFEENWQKSVQQYYQLDRSQLEQILVFLPFKISDRSIRSDFQDLVIQQWLKRSGKAYQKISSSELRDLVDSLTSTKAQIAPAEVEFGFLHEELSILADNFYRPINEQRRFFILNDYIVPQGALDLVEDWQARLKTIWERAEVPPIKIRYRSASLGITDDYVVYPVCIYYYQRAPYLCAFGETPRQKEPIWWYNYRFDRIRSLTELKWTDNLVPAALKQDYKLKKLRSPEDSQLLLGEALGFDFYQPKATILLRFNSDFDRRYIKNTVRHPEFKPIEISAAERSITTAKLPQNRQAQLMKILQKFPTDAYYQVASRLEENNVVMRLRSWSPNVEVILPWDLRTRMKKDLSQSWEMYRNDVD
jgi:CRISPR-associated protein (TIGR03985 family)